MTDHLSLELLATLIIDDPSERLAAAAQTWAEQDALLARLESELATSSN